MPQNRLKFNSPHLVGRSPPITKHAICPRRSLARSRSRESPRTTTARTTGRAAPDPPHGRALRTHPGSGAALSASECPCLENRVSIRRVFAILLKDTPHVVRSDLAFERYYQTFSRIGAGLGMLAMGAWFLWPRSSSSLLDREEALFAFLVSVFVWLATEIKRSEEVVFQDSTKNDIRLARELVGYSRFQLRHLLKDHDFHRGLEPRFLTEAEGLLSDWELKIAFFQDKRLAPLFEAFCNDLSAFDRYFAVNSGYERFGSVYRQSILTPDEADQWDVPAHKLSVIQETNHLASKSWNSFERLVQRVRERVPEAFDETISNDWYRSTEVPGR